MLGGDLEEDDDEVEVLASNSEMWNSEEWEDTDGEDSEENDEHEHPNAQEGA